MPIIATVSISKYIDISNRIDYEIKVEIPLGIGPKEYLNSLSKEQLESYLKDDDIAGMEHGNYREKRHELGIPEIVMIEAKDDYFDHETNRYYFDPKGFYYASEQTIITNEIDQREVNQVFFNMIKCPMGSFMMGADRYHFVSPSHPEHQVEMNQNFWIGETAVTQALWQSVMDVNFSHFKGNLKLPAENMTWYDCLVFCNKLSELEGFEKSYFLSDIQMDGQHINRAHVKWNRNANGYRLPTEAEWEYAAKANTDENKLNLNELNDSAWWDGNSKAQTHEVKSKKPNEWKLYDMIGNVWEWCHDAFDAGIYRKRTNFINPVHWLDQPCTRVLRGSSCRNVLTGLTIDRRYKSEANEHYSNRGLRLFRPAD